MRGIPTRERKMKLVCVSLCMCLMLFLVPLFTVGFMYAQKEVQVKVDARNLHMKTGAKTVGDVLEQAKITLDQDDKVYPDKNALVETGMTITVKRVVEKVESKRNIIPYKMERRVNPKLTEGKIEIIQQGRNGIRECVVKVTYVDGKPVKKEVVTEKMVKNPMNKIVAVGAKRTVSAVKTSRGALRYKRVINMNASAYAPDPRCTGGKINSRTASGMKAGYGVVAVDPRVIPLGSRLYIAGYGLAVAGDTGGSIKGNKIDLCYETYDEALSFGRKTVSVYVLE